MMKVLLMQMDVVNNVSKNYHNFKKMLDKWISKISGGLIVMPELFLTGYDIKAIDDFMDNHMHILDEIHQISKDNNCWFYASFPIIQNGIIYNMAKLIGPNKIVNYAKSHLFEPMGEKELFYPGREIVTTQLNKFIAGLSICYDLRFPELYRVQVRAGASLFIISAEWPLSRIDHWITLLKARAIENQCYVIAVNRIGTDHIAEFGGNSLVIAPDGRIIEQMDNHEGSILLNINYEQLKQARENIFTTNDIWIDDISVKG